MSSLDGALAPLGHIAFDNHYSADHHIEPFPQIPDVEMRTGSSLEHAPQDEEMEDLFGNDNDVEEVKQIDGWAFLRRCIWGHFLTVTCLPSAASEHTSDRGTTPEKEPRNPLEYDEDDQPPEEGILQRKEADVAIPNIPVPHSSNGEVIV
jgi:RNA polymerase-associated protein LEO1